MSDDKYHCSHGERGKCFQCSKDQAAARAAGFAEGLQSALGAVFAPGPLDAAAIRQRVLALSPSPDLVVVPRATLEQAREALDAVQHALIGESEDATGYFAPCLDRAEVARVRAALAALDGVLR